MAYVSISFGDVVSMETMSISNPDYKQAVLKMTDNAGNNLGIHMPPTLATAIAEVFTAHQKSQIIAEVVS